MAHSWRNGNLKVIKVVDPATNQEKQYLTFKSAEEQVKDLDALRMGQERTDRHMLTTRLPPDPYSPRTATPAAPC